MKTTSLISPYKSLLSAIGDAGKRAFGRKVMFLLRGWRVVE